MRHAKKRNIILWWVVTGLIAYAGCSSLVYQFKHPEMTETQRFNKLPDALLWRD